MEADAVGSVTRTVPGGQVWFGLACDDLRLVGLKLVVLVITRALSLLGLSRRESWWKDAEILMLRHQLPVALRKRPRAHSRLTWPDRAWLALLAGDAAGRCGQPVENGVRQGQSLNYGFVDRVATPDWTGIPGSVGCRWRHRLSEPRHLLGRRARRRGRLREAERFGGKRQMGPERASTGLVAGYFTVPRANLTGVAGPV
jgi:hypothetical protein